MGCLEALFDRQGFLGVNDLAFVVDHPKAIFTVAVADGDIAAFFEAMRYGALVFAVYDPVLDLCAHCCGRDPAEGCGVRVSHAVEYVRQLGVFGCAVRVRNIPKRMSLPRRCFRVKRRKIEPGRIPR
jgi:hypothetical protein